MCFKINHAIIIIQYLFGFTFFCKFYCSCFVLFNQLLNVRLSDLYIMNVIGACVQIQQTILDHKTQFVTSDG